MSQVSRSAAPVQAPRQIRNNAFAVLGLTPSASRREIESVARRTLAQLELGVVSAATFPCPVTGTAQRRNPSLLRDALTRLRVPSLRAREELWWRLAKAWR